MDYSTDIVSELHSEVQEATASERFAQGLYVVARMGFQLATFRTQDAELTT